MPSIQETSLNNVLNERLLNQINYQNELTENNIVGTFYRYGGKYTKGVTMATQITPVSRMRHNTVSSYSQRKGFSSTGPR